MNQQYFKILRNLKTENRQTMKFVNCSFFDYFFRQVGTFLSPAFIILKIHPTTINMINLICGMIAFLTVYLNEDFLNYGIMIYYLSVIVDNTDGNIARYTKHASFFGRFVDGLIDIIVLGFIRLALFYFILKNYDSEVLLLLSLLSILLISITHLYYDRYSAISRWSNELNKTKVNPYIRNKYGKKINFLMIDLQHLFLLLILIFYQQKEFLENFILLFLILSITHFIFNSYIHIRYSYKFLKNSKNPKRNN